MEGAPGNTWTDHPTQQTWNCEDALRPSTVPSTQVTPTAFPFSLSKKKVCMSPSA